MDIKISIIIPLYNAKTYIKACVDSLLEQTLQEVEIILVNDCSTDGSMEYVRELYGNNPKMVFIEQPKNMGPGAARNAGIAVAKGKYIAFVDSDDQMDAQGFQKMYEAAEENHAEVLHVTSMRTPVADVIPIDMRELTGSDVVETSWDMKNRAEELTVLSDNLEERLAKWQLHSYHWSVWNKLYLREFIEKNQLLFYDMKMAEDMQFCFCCLFLAKRYVILPGAYYYYRIVENSLSRGKKNTDLIVKSLEAELGSAKAMKEAMKKIPFFAESEDHAQQAMFYVMNSLELWAIRPAFREIGYEEVRKDKKLQAFFDDHFGENADFIAFQFIKMHGELPETIDRQKWVNDKKAWKEQDKNGRRDEK